MPEVEDTVVYKTIVFAAGNLGRGIASTLSIPAEQAHYLQLVESREEETASKQTHGTVALHDTGILTSGYKIAKSEGWRRLWKGLFSLHLLHTLTDDVLEPSIKDGLLLVAGIPQAKTHYFLAPTNPANQLSAIIASKVITRVLLNPIDLVSTRIMVQSYKPGHQKYKNSWSALVQIIREEGWKSLYYNRYMAPKILLELVMAASDSVIPLVLVRYFGLQMKSVRYGVSRFALGMVFSLAVMPLDTIVRRMQAQIVVSCQKADSRGVVQFKTTVATDQVPYKNMGDCIERVVREEERALKKRGTKGKGWGALYRGWQSAILLNLINALFESHLDEYAGL